MPDLVPVGRVGRPHGLDGAFVVEHPSDDEQQVSRRRGAPLRRCACHRGALAACGRASAGDQARPPGRARGQQLAVDRAELPPPSEGHFYVFELVGLAVVDDTGREVGTVRDVLPGVANDNLELSNGALVPMIEDAVLRDRRRRRAGSSSRRLRRVTGGPRYPGPPCASMSSPRFRTPSRWMTEHAADRDRSRRRARAAALQLP